MLSAIEFILKAEEVTSNEGEKLCIVFQKNL